MHMRAGSTLTDQMKETLVPTGTKKIPPGLRMAVISFTAFVWDTTESPSCP